MKTRCYTSGFLTSPDSFSRARLSRTVPPAPIPAPARQARPVRARRAAPRARRRRCPRTATM
jgi:hypothetical protein